jgi:hypothetical protein
MVAAPTKEARGELLCPWSHERRRAGLDLTAPGVWIFCRLLNELLGERDFLRSPNVSGVVLLNAYYEHEYSETSIQGIYAPCC